MTSPRTNRGADEFPLLPAGFRLGTVSAAYQVEGAADADGRGPSIWDTFVRTPGRVSGRATGDVACDSYHRYGEDVELLAKLGVNSHRFSISWPRVQPTGRGPANPAGLDHYDRMVDALLEAGIEPMATLYHWDLPQALEDDGGWLNRATAEAFGEYAALVGERLADRVTHWVPVNDPNVASIIGYGVGGHAPGRMLSFDCLPAGHHLLLAHGLAAIALREAGATSVGCATNHAPIWPSSDEPEDTGASKLFDMLWNGAFMEPVLLGRYPMMLESLLEDAVLPGDLATIRQPLDFYGLNFQNPMRVGAAPEGHEVPFVRGDVVGYPVTDTGAPVVPDSLREYLIMFRARYRAALPPIYVTEVGCSFAGTPGPDGVVDDCARADYLADHLQAVSEAVNRGVDVRGVYVSSLLDGFNWSYGYRHQEGLVSVDRETLARTPKRSYEWFRQMIASQPHED